MLSQLVCIDEISVCAIDVWSIVHFVASFIIFNIIFALIRSLPKRRPKTPQGKPVSRRSSRVFEGVSEKVRRQLLWALVLTIIIGVAWEIVENSVEFTSLGLPSFSREDSLLNLSFDIIFDVFGGLAGLGLMSLIIKNEKRG